MIINSTGQSPTMSRFEFCFWMYRASHTDVCHLKAVRKISNPEGFFTLCDQNVICIIRAFRKFMTHRACAAGLSSQSTRITKLTFAWNLCLAKLYANDLFVHKSLVWNNTGKNHELEQRFWCVCYIFFLFLYMKLQKSFQL